MLQRLCPSAFIERQPAISEYEALQLKLDRELAEKGSAEAQYNLGTLYLAGQGVPEDVAEALKWFRKAAEQGSAMAQFNLGIMNDQGRSLSQLETDLVARLSASPGDDQVRFALGATQFIRTVEGMSQDLYRYGLRAPKETELFLPFFRFPLPVNPNPEHLDYDKMRSVFQKALNGFLNTDATLAGLGNSEIRLPVHLGLVRLDLNGDGMTSDKESLFALFNASLGGNQIPPEAGARFIIAFDRGDAAWLRGYVNLLSALIEFVLAHDGKASFDVSAQMLFPNAKLPNEILNRQGRPISPEFDGMTIADFIAAIHMMHWPVTEPKRMNSALGYLEQMIDLSRESWRYILAETDDEAEWIPSPRQNSGVIPGMPVTQQTVDGWMQFLTELDAILKGQKLVPHWRLAKGINIRRVFLEPKAFDPILWAQGSAALPYVEEGPVTDTQTWWQIMEMFKGNFLGFAVWFN